MKTEFAPFFGQVNIARAYEIAITGGYKIALARFDRKTEKAVFDEFDPVIKMFIDIMHGVATGGSYSQRENAHIIIEIPFIDFKSMFLTYKQETLQDIRQRSAETIKRHHPNDEEAIWVRPGKSYDMNEGCFQLLKTAYERLSLTANDVKQILDVAYTIAAMDCDAGKIQVKVEHVAEAIQYKCFDPENWS